jgi:hypothetical protein
MHLSLVAVRRVFFIQLEFFFVAVLQIYSARRCAAAMVCVHCDDGLVFMAAIMLVRLRP